MKEILLTQGKVALVDDDDYEELNKHKWFVKKTNKSYVIYAVRHKPRPNNKIIAMHRIIMNAIPGMDIDHIDGNGLNNQKSNLRICTRSQNRCNVNKRKDNVCGFKGVSFDKESGKFKTQIMFNGVMLYRGRFKTAIEAAIKYDEVAIKYHGEFARLNFPRKGMI